MEEVKFDCEAGTQVSVSEDKNKLVVTLGGEIKTLKFTLTRNEAADLAEAIDIMLEEDDDDLDDFDDNLDDEEEEDDS
jgi:hypothetical protein